MQLSHISVYCSHSNSRSNSSGSFPFQVFTAPQKLKKTWAPQQAFSRFSTPIFINSDQDRGPSPVLEKAQSVDLKFISTKHKLFEMNKLRIECNEILQSTKGDAIRRAAVSKSSNKKDHSNRCSDAICLPNNEIYTNPKLPLSSNISPLADHYLPSIKLPNSVIARKSEPNYPIINVHPKPVPFIQSIFSLRKKKCGNENPFEQTECISGGSSKSYHHFMDRLPLESKLYSGQPSPARYFFERENEIAHFPLKINEDVMFKQ